MRLEILSIGKIKEPYILAGEHEYTKRLPQWAHLLLTEVPIDKLSKLSRRDYNEQQDAVVVERCKPGTALLVLDESGRQFTSTEFAKLLSSFKENSTKHILFAIGGPDGWGNKTTERAHTLISMSPLTFPHHLCRLILIEQIYRATAILSGTSYHK